MSASPVRHLGSKRRTAYEHRGKYAEFAQEWDDAVEDGIDGLEAIAHQRALKSSDALMMFLLKVKRYQPRLTVEHSGSIQHLQEPQSRTEEDEVLREHGILGI